MRALFAIVMILALGWSGYWFIGSSAKESAIISWLEDRQKAGWIANYDSLKIKGFPNRFDTRIETLELADPNSGWAWSAPEFQVLALSYQPNHVIAAWPETQKLSSTYETISITSSDMKASVVFEPNTGLALDRSTLTVADLGLTSTEGWTNRMEKVVLATRQSDTLEFGHDLAFDAQNFAPAKLLKSRIDPEGSLPAVFQTVHLEATVGFDAPWDRAAIEAGAPELTHVDIGNFKAVWGELELRLKGAVDIDARGFPVGQISIKAKKWREMLSLAKTAGAISPELAATLESGLGLIALLSGNKDSLDAPLSFSNGLVHIGPIPIGPAPRLTFLRR